MIEIVKPFRDSHFDLTRRRVGEKHDFGKERNESLIRSGFAKSIYNDNQKEKKTTPETKEKKTRRRTKNKS